MEWHIVKKVELIFFLFEVEEKQNVIICLANMTHFYGVGEWT